MDASTLMRRLSLIEDRIDNLRDHINLIENNFIEKNKAVLKEIRELHEKNRELRNSMTELEEDISQMADKFNDFATKQQLKVLERYLYFLNPLDYVTKKEVKDLIKEQQKDLDTQELEEE